MKLPKTIYVKVVKENDAEYFVADNSVSNLVLEVGDKIKVGVYELVETLQAEAILETKTVKR